MLLHWHQRTERESPAGSKQWQADVYYRVKADSNHLTDVRALGMLQWRYARVRGPLPSFLPCSPNPTRTQGHVRGRSRGVHRIYGAIVGRYASKPLCVGADRETKWGSTHAGQAGRGDRPQRSTCVDVYDALRIRYVLSNRTAVTVQLTDFAYYTDTAEGRPHQHRSHPCVQGHGRPATPRRMAMSAVECSKAAAKYVRSILE